MKKKSFINPLDVCFSQFFISFLSAIDNYEMINGIVLWEVYFMFFLNHLSVSLRVGICWRIYFIFLWAELVVVCLARHFLVDVSKTLAKICSFTWPKFWQIHTSPSNSETANSAYQFSFFPLLTLHSLTHTPRMSQNASNRVSKGKKEKKEENWNKIKMIFYEKSIFIIMEIQFFFSSFYGINKKFNFAKKNPLSILPFFVFSCFVFSSSK